MTAHILSIPGSARIEPLKKRLFSAQIDDFLIHEGRITPFRFDGLFETIKWVIEQNRQSPYALILEDDVVFTHQYSLARLEKIAREGKQLCADIILGGIKEGSRLARVSDDLFRVHNYRGSQLMIIYRQFYDRIIKARIDQEFEIFCSYSDRINKYVAYPFLAYQADGPSRFLSRQTHIQDYMGFEKQIATLI